MKPLFLNELQSLVDKKIQWTAEGYSANGNYGGECIILQVDINGRWPILDSAIIIGDDIKFGFSDTYSLTEIVVYGSTAYEMAEITDRNNCICYSDSYREIFYKVID